MKHALSLAAGTADDLWLEVAQAVQDFGAVWVLDVLSAKASPESADIAMARARALMAAQQFAAAAALVEGLLETQPNDADMWAFLGHARYAAGDKDAAHAAYVKCLDAKADATDSVVLLRLAQHAASTAAAMPAGSVQQATWTRARDSALRACRLRPTSATWLEAGKACMHLGLVVDGEQCLSEASVLNHRNASVWGHLALLCFRQGRTAEAKEVSLVARGARALALPLTRAAPRGRRAVRHAVPAPGPLRPRFARATWRGLRPCG